MKTKPEKWIVCSGGGGNGADGGIDLPSSTYGAGLFVAGNVAYVTQETSDSKGVLTIIDLGH
jgi:hypothetical protein